MFANNLGKVFVSHSSADKPFVRRLAKKLEQAGYSIWLDEKELRAGDALSKKIANALNTSAAVIVVVSCNSVRSKWLRYELGIATERMIKGECRVIPAVIDDANLPPEVVGLLYADFRRRFVLGFKAIISALEHEKQRRLATSPIYVRVANIVRKVFDGFGYASTVGNYKDKDWTVVSVPVPSRDDPDSTSVLYDWVSSYTKPPRPLSVHWLEDLHEFVDQIVESLSLIVTDQPLGFSVTRPNPSYPQVSFIKRHGGGAFSVFVELGSVDEERWTQLIAQARLLLTEFARRLPGPRDDG